MANTDAYLALGLVVTVTVIGGYALSLVARLRQTVKTIATLKTVAED